MCRFWAGGISSFPFSRAREYRLLRRLCLAELVSFCDSDILHMNILFGYKNAKQSPKQAMRREQGRDLYKRCLPKHKSHERAAEYVLSVIVGNSQFL
jgi:hypothetical protein